MRTKLILLLTLSSICYFESFAQKADSIPLSKQLSEVEISASKKPSSFQSTSPLQIVTSKSLDEQGIQSLSDAIRRFSGVSVRDYGGIGGVKTVSVRGMGAQHTAVSYDGVTISNVQSGQIDIGRITLDNIAYISLTIGQSDNIFQTARAYASAALVDIQTTSSKFTNSKHEVNIKVKTGSFGLVNPSVYYAQAINNKFSFSLNSGWERADGRFPFTFKNNKKLESAKRLNSDTDIKRLEFNLFGRISDKQNIQFKANYYDSERGIPGPIIFYNQDNDERVWNKDFFAQAKYLNKWNSKVELQTQLKFTRTYYKFIKKSNNVGEEGDTRQQVDRVTQFEYYGSIGALYKPCKGVSISLVEDLFENRLNNNMNIANKPKRVTSLTLLASEFKTNRMSITGSLLGTYIDEKVESEDSLGNRKKITPAFSISVLPFNFANIRLRASYKNIFRVPTFNDLYYLRMGNINLKPEYSKQYNIGATWVESLSDKIDYISLAVDAYKNRVKDKIVARPTANIAVMRNFGKVDMTGVDINSSIHVQITKKIGAEVSANYSYQRVIDITDKNDEKAYKNQIPYTPKNYGSGAIVLKNPIVNISYSIIASGKRYKLDQNIPENELEAYTDHSISLSKSVHISNKKLNLQASLLNIGNKNYQIIDSYPMPGRSFVISANINL